jgi:hypothetical protein
MGLLDSSVVSNITASQNVLSAGASAVNVAKNLSSALSAPMSADGVMSAVRSSSLPIGGEAIGDLFSAVASFGGDANANDWRVRLSLPTWPSFRTSPVLAPLKDSGGLIFPYTPEIKIQSSATYSSISTVHSNYLFKAYQNSDPGTITITAPMNVEDHTQGLYWIAAVHYLRSMTKMFTGQDPKAGNPPPIVFLNGYGNYVFKNVPVVVTSFTTSLDASCDYIGVNVVGSAAGAVQGLSESIGGLSDAIGGAFSDLVPGLGDVTGGVSSLASGVGSIAAIAGTFGIGGSVSGGVSHVPTKSSFSITLQPMYSRSSVRNFSLDRFVQGGYLNNSFGYI